MKNIWRFLSAFFILSIGLSTLIAIHSTEAAPLQIDCPRADVQVVITSPKPNETVSGVVQIEGSTQVPDFQAYQLSVSPASGNAFGPIGQEVRQLVVNGQLGVWDSASVADGAYTIRLRAIDNARQYCDTTLNVTVNNTRPSPTPFPTDEPTDTPAPNQPTAVPQITIPGETPFPTSTPRSSPTPGGSSTLGLNFDAIFGTVGDFFQLLGRTCLFGVAVGAGIMFVVGVIYFARRII